MNTKDPPSMIAAIYLSRLRDRSMGQTDEIQGLLDMMKAMKQIADVIVLIAALIGSLVVFSFNTIVDQKIAYVFLIPLFSSAVGIIFVIVKRT